MLNIKNRAFFSYLKQKRRYDVTKGTWYNCPIYGTLEQYGL